MKFYHYKLKEVRRRQRFTIKELAIRCNVSRQTISRWEDGSTIPHESKIRYLCDILGVKTDELSDIVDAPVAEQGLEPVINTLKSLDCKEVLDQFKNEKQMIVNFIKKKYDQLDQVSIFFSAMMNSIPSILYIKNIDLCYEIANKAFLDNISVSHDFNVLGKRDSDLFTAEEAKKNDAEDLKVIRSGKPVENREDFIISTRKKKIGLVSKHPIFNEKNEIIGVVGCIVDISKVKEFELNQTLINKALDNINICLSVAEYSESTYDFFGIPKGLTGDALDEYWFKTIHPDDRKTQEMIFRNGNIPKERTYRIIHPTKGLRIIKVVNFSTRIFNKRYLISLSTDITK
jgi:transcriptional regulator with XRE-family HTH domain